VVQQIEKVIKKAGGRLLKDIKVFDVYTGDKVGEDENTAKAPSYTLVGLFTGYKYNYHNLTVDLFGRVDNLFDKEYVGSVIVNESNGRYYEPSPGRNYGVGMNIAWRFE